MDPWESRLASYPYGQEGLQIANEAKLTVGRWPEAKLFSLSHPDYPDSKPIDVLLWPGYGVVMPGHFTTNGSILESAQGVEIRIAQGYKSSSEVVDKLYSFETHECPGGHPWTLPRTSKLMLALRVAVAILSVRLKLAMKEDRL